jgi:hypothetical protein
MDTQQHQLLDIRCMEWHRRWHRVFSNSITAYFVVIRSHWYKYGIKPEAPPPENTDYMFSIRPEFIGRKDCKGYAFAILHKVDTNSTNFIIRFLLLKKCHVKMFWFGGTTANLIRLQTPQFCSRYFVGVHDWVPPQWRKGFQLPQRDFRRGENNRMDRIRLFICTGNWAQTNDSQRQQN